MVKILTSLGAESSSLSDIASVTTRLEDLRSEADLLLFSSYKTLVHEVKAFSTLSVECVRDPPKLAWERGTEPGNLAHAARAAWFHVIVI